MRTFVTSAHDRLSQDDYLCSSVIWRMLVYLPGKKLRWTQS